MRRAHTRVIWIIDEKGRVRFGKSRAEPLNIFPRDPVPEGLHRIEERTETDKAADRKSRGFFLHKCVLGWISKLTSCCMATRISSSAPDSHFVSWPFMEH